MNDFRSKANFIWSVADLLRGNYKQSEYQRVILPLTVLKRLDDVLAPTKDRVLAKNADLKKSKIENKDPVLKRAASQSFYNTSKYTFASLLQDPDGLAANLRNYIEGFSPKAYEIIEHFRFDEQIDRLNSAKLLFKVMEKFNGFDFHPDKVSNREMGYVFEDLIRRFSEISNETAGEHFTPREVIELMVNLLFDKDDDALRAKGAIRKLYDPACGTGGMLSVAEEHLLKLNPDATLEVYGQELNPETYATCNADMLVKGQNPDRIILGNTFSEDGLKDERFDYMLTNPPFGVEWKNVEEKVREEHEKQGHGGRFGAGLPRINDGSFLFLQHMLARMKVPEKGGSRIGIVFNGSPLFTGGAGSGESEIRRHVLENDLLEAIIALPDNMFYNTGIHTYIWVLTNRKPKRRKGKVQLVDAREMFRKMRKSLGNKRHELAPEHIETITNLYGDFKEGKHSKVFPNEAFGYRRITVERPLRRAFQATPERLARLEHEKGFIALATSKKKGAAGAKEEEEGRRAQEQVKTLLGKLDPAKVWRSHAKFEAELEKLWDKGNPGVALNGPLRKAILGALGEPDAEAEALLDKDGAPVPDPDLRDYENVPLGEDLQAYMKREVLPHVPDAWVDEGKVDAKDGKVGVVGFEINFNRYFYEYKPPRALEEIDRDIKTLEGEILAMLRGVAD